MYSFQTIVISLIHREFLYNKNKKMAGPLSYKHTHTHKKKLICWSVMQTAAGVKKVNEIQRRSFIEAAHLRWQVPNKIPPTLRWRETVDFI